MPDKSYDWAGMMDPDDPLVALYLDAAKAWIEKNTTFVFEEGKPLPSGIKAFLVQYCQTMAQGGAVQSESIGGMSQTFKSESLDALLRQWATALLPDYFSNGRFIGAQRRWC
ncbi:hypothetical protein LJC49_04510 [Ruminococcaceae bacterium OttesenSCG-928-I18]|nr:hypothetical protein [Ruminococcaceae bacterium OttesenSCG-928-I18]